MYPLIAICYPVQVHGDPACPQAAACGVEAYVMPGGIKFRSTGAGNCVQAIAGGDPDLVKRAFEIAYDDRGNVISKGAQNMNIMVKINLYVPMEKMASWLKSMYMMRLAV